VGGCPSALRCGGRRCAPTGRPGCAGSVREARLRLVHTDSAVLAACGRGQNSRPACGGPVREAFGLANPSHGRQPAVQAAYARSSNSCPRPDRLTAIGQPARRCAPRRRRGAQPDTHPRLCVMDHGGSAKPRPGGGRRASAAARSAASRRLPHRRKAMGSSAVCSRSERKRLAQQDAGRARRPPSRRLRGPGRPQVGPRVRRSPPGREHRRARVDEVWPRLTGRPGAAGPLGRHEVATAAAKRRTPPGRGFARSVEARALGGATCTPPRPASAAMPSTHPRCTAQAPPR